MCSTCLKHTCTCMSNTLHVLCLLASIISWFSLAFIIFQLCWVIVYCLFKSTKPHNWHCARQWGMDTVPTLTVAENAQKTSWMNKDPVALYCLGMQETYRISIVVKQQHVHTCMHTHIHKLLLPLEGHAHLGRARMPVH